MPILGDFAVKYADFAKEFGVPTDDLYQALVDTAENTVSLPLQSSSISADIHDAKKPEDWYFGGSLSLPLRYFK